MSVKSEDIRDQKDRMLEDVECVLEGIDDMYIINEVRNIIIDRMDYLANKMCEAEK